MASTHTQRTLLTSQALSAGASVNATEWDLTTAYGGVAVVRLTNGGTAPTTAPTVSFYVGSATGVTRLLWQGSGNTTNSSVTDVPCVIPLGVMFVNITITWGATTGGTVEAYGQETTTI